MNIGIFYATYSGGTEAVSEILEDACLAHGHNTMRKRIRTVSAEDLRQDICIFGTPSWWVDAKDGQPHEDYISFIQTIKLPPHAKVAIFGLGDERYPQFCGGAKALQKLFTDQGIKEILQPLLINKYYFAEQQNNEKVKAWAQAFLDAATAS